MTPSPVLSPVLQLSAKGYSRTVVCRFQADKETLSEAIRHHYNAGKLYNYVFPDR